MFASFVTLASYDWRLLPTSIAAYYDVAEEIIVGLDADRLTWSGLAFPLARHGLQVALRQVDPEDKIRICEEPFYRADRTPRENNTAEYRFLGEQARGEWIVNVDADEILTEPEKLMRALDTSPPDAQWFGRWRNIFKVLGDVALVVTPEQHLCALATRSRKNFRAKLTHEPPAFCPVTVEHLTLGRSAAEVALKLASWGHRDEVLPGWFERWQGITLETYREESDVHPFDPPRWPGLRAVPTAELAWGGYLQRAVP